MVMENKLVCVNEYSGTVRIVEVIVEKETAKQFRVKPATFVGRNVVNKAELGKPTGYGEIFCYEKDAKRLAKELIDKKIEGTLKHLEVYKRQLDNLEKSLEDLGLKGV